MAASLLLLFGKSQVFYDKKLDEAAGYTVDLDDDRLIVVDGRGFLDSEEISGEAKRVLKNNSKKRKKGEKVKFAFLDTSSYRI